MDPSTQSASSFLTRWAAPVGVIWAGVLFSAWIYTEKLPGTVRILTVKLGIILLGTPAASVLLLLVLRAIAQRTGPSSRSGDLVIIWVMTFMFGIHALMLAVGIGMIDSPTPGLCGVVALLMLGLGLVVRNVEPKSPMGIRTAATMGDDATWREAHKRASALFMIAGLIGLFGPFAPGLYGPLAISGLPPVIAVVIAVAMASKAPQDRPSTEDQGKG